MSHCKGHLFHWCLTQSESAARSDTHFDLFPLIRIDCQWLKNRSLSTLKVSSQAPKPHLLLLLFSPFHYRILFIWTKAFCSETEELCRNLVGLSVPIFSLASDAGKLCLCSQRPFVFCCVLRVFLVRWRCVPLSCRCAHFRELFCTALCCNVLSSHSRHARSPCLCSAERCLGHEDPGLGDVQSWEGWDSAGALAETGEGINSFKGLGYPNRLQGNLSSTETLLIY